MSKIKKLNYSLITLNGILIFGIAEVFLELQEQYKFQGEAQQIFSIKKIERRPEEIKEVKIPGQVREVSAYNAGDEAQTDSSPCIAASGENICEALAAGRQTCAANFVPFGTILEVEGVGKCEVVDRMNSRYPNSVDLAFKKDEVNMAIGFGRRNLLVKILE